MFQLLMRMAPWEDSRVRTYGFCICVVRVLFRFLRCVHLAPLTSRSRAAARAALGLFGAPPWPCSHAARSPLARGSVRDASREHVRRRSRAARASFRRRSRAARDAALGGAGSLLARAPPASVARLARARTLGAHAEAGRVRRTTAQTALAPRPRGDGFHPNSRAWRRQPRLRMYQRCAPLARRVVPLSSTVWLRLRSAMAKSLEGQPCGPGSSCWAQ